MSFFNRIKEIKSKLTKNYTCNPTTDDHVVSNGDLGCHCGEYKVKLFNAKELEVIEALLRHGFKSRGN